MNNVQAMKEEEKNASVEFWDTFKTMQEEDQKIKADIIEEITRIYGYDNFAINTTRSPLYPVRMDTVKSNEDKIKDILVKRYNLHELHSYVWAYNDELKALNKLCQLYIETLNSQTHNVEKRALNSLYSHISNPLLNTVCTRLVKWAVSVYVVVNLLSFKLSERYGTCNRKTLATICCAHSYARNHCMFATR